MLTPVTFRRLSTTASETPRRHQAFHPYMQSVRLAQSLGDRIERMRDMYGLAVGTRLQCCVDLGGPATPEVLESTRKCGAMLGAAVARGGRVLDVIVSGERIDRDIDVWQPTWGEYLACIDRCWSDFLRDRDTGARLAPA